MLKSDASIMATHYDRKFIWQAMRDYKSYVQIGIYMGFVLWKFAVNDLLTYSFPLRSIVIPIYAIALFTPTIINELGYSAANAQLLSVPPFAVGGVFTILVGIYSDKYRIRGPIIAGCAFISLIGYIVLYTQKAAGAGYAGALIAAAGVFPTVAVDLAWAGGNAGGDLKRGVVIAMVVGLGNLGGFVFFCFVYAFFEIQLIRVPVYAPRLYILILRASISATELCKWMFIFHTNYCLQVFLIYIAWDGLASRMLWIPI